MFRRIFVVAKTFFRLRVTMLRVSIICNTAAAFPLIQWCHSQRVLAGIAILDSPAEWADDLAVVAGQLQIPVKKVSVQRPSEDLLDWQKTTRADVILVLGFPRKIGTKVLESVPLGVFNFHFGALPAYAGSFPLFWQIRNREVNGLLTIHQMTNQMDGGAIAVEVPVEILLDQPFGIAEAKYSFAAVPAAAQLLNALLQKTLVLCDQQAGQPKCPSGRPTLKDLIIQWSQMDAQGITALVKATNPWNRGAIARINGLDVKIIDAKPGPPAALQPGQVQQMPDGAMVVGCQGSETVIILQLYCSYGYFQKEGIWSIGIQPGHSFENIRI
jgi:methionyl-tRNA formyltransferase